MNWDEEIIVKKINEIHIIIKDLGQNIGIIKDKINQSDLRIDRINKRIDSLQEENESIKQFCIELNHKLSYSSIGDKDGHELTTNTCDSKSSEVLAVNGKGDKSTSCLHHCKNSLFSSEDSFQICNERLGDGDVK